MVIEDLRNSIIENKEKLIAPEREPYIASTNDRLAAFIIDYIIILLPIIFMVTAPLKRIIFDAAIVSDEAIIFFSILLMGLVGIFCVVLYNTIMVWLYGASLGKKIMSLRVVNVWSLEKPRFSLSLLRASTWFLGFLTLGFSYSSIFSNNKRRALHDRISETLVVTQKNRAAQPPTFVESSIARGAFAGFLAFIILLSVVLAFNAYKQMNQGTALLSFMEQTGELCDVVGEAQKVWPEENNEEASRLSIAMAMYATGSLSSDCLEGEANFLFQHNSETALAYLAKAFIYSDRIKLSDSYLAKVCAKDQESPHCHMSKIVSYWAENNWISVTQEFEKISSEQSYVYINIWKIRHYLKMGDHQMVTLLLNDLPTVDSLKDFRIRFKTMALWGQKAYDKANVAADIARESLLEHESASLSDWLCYESYSTSCEPKAMDSCRVMEEELSRDPSLMHKDMIALASLKKSYCQENNIEKLLSSQMSREIYKLSEAVSLLKKDKNSAKNRLWAIIVNKNSSLRVRSEAARYYITSYGNDKDLLKLIIHWNILPQTLEWQKTGQLLFSQLVKINSFAQAVAVGSKIKEFNDGDESFMRDLVISYFKSGKKEEAWGFVKNMNFAQSQREPANQNNFEQIYRELKKEYLK